VERSKANRSGAGRKAFRERLVGAPISWGVCEVPGWGFQMERERVLAELRGVGLAATERGPDGFLPGSPAEMKAALGRHGLRLVAGFVPVVLHRPADRERQLGGVEAAARLLAESGAEVLVLAAASGEEGYERGGRLSEAEWQSLFKALEACAGIAGRNGLRITVHPHYGTVVETDEHVSRLLAGSDVPLCVDVGHLAVAGASALDVVDRANGRVAHVHLKDVNAGTAARVRSGEIGYHAAVAEGLYCPLGEGGARIAEVVELLESRGYAGYYVLEQDAVLAGDPAAGDGPVRDVRKSLDFLATVVPAPAPH
jgi:inosose dehydratase